MDDQTVKQGGRNATKLVWTITLLGLGAGIVMLGIVYWTIWKIQSGREKMDTFQAALTHMVTTLDTYLTQGHDDIGQLLSRKSPKADTGQWVDDLAKLTAGDKLSPITGNDDIRRALNQLGEQVLGLNKLRNDSLAWSVQADRLRIALPGMRQKVEKSLAMMGAAIIGIEGRQRLERAIRVRQYRRSTSKQVNKLAYQIIEGMGRESEIFTIKTELADLALLCERLLGEDQIDDLADLKDNKFKLTIDRLRRGINLLGNLKIKTPEKIFPVALLDALTTDLFGLGFKVDNIHQTIVPGQGGVYLLIREKLLLAARRDDLRQQKDRIFNAVDSAHRKLVGIAEGIAFQTAGDTEKALSKTWNTMLSVWIAFFSVFLILSVKITQAVKRQITAIETTNENLTAEIYERRKVESALRQSEDALRKAKDELEMRVEERTSELKGANKQLAKQIIERKSAEDKLRRRGRELSEALKITRKAHFVAESERDRSGKMLAEVTESKRRLEILISDATAREKRMVDLKREVNTILKSLGRNLKYRAPQKVDAFLSR